MHGQICSNGSNVVATAIAVDVIWIVFYSNFNAFYVVQGNWTFAELFVRWFAVWEAKCHQANSMTLIYSSWATDFHHTHFRSELFSRSKLDQSIVQLYSFSQKRLAIAHIIIITLNIFSSLLGDNRFETLWTSYSSYSLHLCDLCAVYASNYRWPSSWHTFHFS